VWQTNTIALWRRWRFQNLFGFTSRFLERFHDLVIVWLVLILFLVILVSFRVFVRPKSSISLNSILLEQVWTVIPILVLFSIAFPRIYLLCSQDSIRSFPNRTIKIISNQWNWQREQLNVLDHLLDSEAIDVLASFEYPLALMVGSISRISLVRADVLHSLGLPNLGVKLDATPGRIRVTLLESLYAGKAVGSCYELCGRGHRAIPIHFLIIFRIKLNRLSTFKVLRKI